MSKTKLAIIFFLYFTLVTGLTLKNYLSSLTVPQNILILGLDPRNDLLETTKTTDTIIYARISTDFSAVKLYSLPRDLWFYPTSQKINSLYPDALLTSNHFDFLQNNFSQIVGQKINKTIIITTENLRQIIDLIGGVDVVLDNELKDTQYPNQAYIDNPKSGAPIYKTIYYPAGQNHLDKNNITEFVRSRKSSDLASSGGTDLGRMKRQQQLFDALMKKIIQIRDYKKLLSLYKYFDTQVSHNFTIKDYLGLGIKFLPKLNSIKLEKVTIPTGENPKTDIIYHPISFINKQWVFITSTPDYQSLKSFISKSLLY